MKRVGFLCVFGLVAALAVPDAAAMAGCVPGPIGGPGDNLIVCNGGIHVSVFGNAGNDTIFLEPGTSITGGLNGDGHTNGPNGDDRIVVRNGVELAPGINPAGDSSAAPGGNDRIQFAAQVDGAVIGDALANHPGGEDVIGILPAGIANAVIGDGATVGAKDTITIAGRVTEVSGDGVVGDGGNDVIAVTAGSAIEDRGGTSVLEGSVAGDTAGGDGGNDFFIIRSSVAGSVIGDNVVGNGGNDFMRIFPAARITQNVLGDSASGNGGNDTIVGFAGSEIGGFVVGDSLLGTGTGRGGNDRMSIGSTVAMDILGDGAPVNGGSDAIGIGGAGSAINLFGDSVGGNGGPDILDVSGSIANVVAGDNATGNGGVDIIYIRTTGVVGHIYGDWVGGNGGNDLIVVNNGGMVNGDIEGDRSTGRGGNDTIVVSGTVGGTILADNSAAPGGNDRITVNPAGLVQGNIDAQRGTNIIRVLGTVNGDILCSATTTLIIGPNGQVGGDTSSC